ncbi:MAG: MFS transporter [Gammaproteobacteria bacterium]|nr:MFS transporter [Gammaproteobacteria bacterium]
MSSIDNKQVFHPGEEFWGQPKGLYICFFTEMWERFSFYGMKALLFLYLIKYHMFGDTPAYQLLGAYGGMVYAVPVIGGLLADRWLGMRKAVVAGAVLLCVGHFGMAFEGEQARLVGGAIQRDEGALQIFYFSLALIIGGVGFLKPNISTIVGKLYPQNDPRRDGGFTIFYAGINVGALFASLICGYLGETFGWKYGFGAAGIGMLLGLIVFLTGQKYLHGHAEPKNPALLKEKVLGPLNREWTIYLGSVLGVAVIWQLMQNTWTVIGAMHIMSAALVAWFTWFLHKKCNRVERQQMLSLVALILMVVVFFTLYEQTYGSWVAFTDRLLTTDLFGISTATGEPVLPWTIVPLVISPLAMLMALRLAGQGKLRLGEILLGSVALLMLTAFVRDMSFVQQTAGSLTFLGAFFIVAFSPLFSWLWPWLDRRGMNPSKPAKSAIGLLLAGLAFLPMAYAAHLAGIHGVASVWWLVLAYGILELGELSISPIGLSAVTQLSVPSVVSVMMGAWFLATAYSEVLAARFGELTSMDVAEGETLDVAVATASYGDMFMMMFWIGVVASAVAFALIPLVRKGMHGVK